MHATKCFTKTPNQQTTLPFCCPVCVPHLQESEGVGHSQLVTIATPGPSCAQLSRCVALSPEAPLWVLVGFGFALH